MSTQHAKSNAPLFVSPSATPTWETPLVTALTGPDDALDAALRAAMDGDVLQLGEESELIAGHWAAGSK